MRYYNSIRITTALFILGTVSVNAFADWGVYPHCHAPGVPIEVHSWWQEPGEQHPRHVHLATCLPNARDMTGDLVSFSGSRTFPSRIMAFNSPGRLHVVRSMWENDHLVQIRTNNTCQDGPDKLQECTWWNNDLLIDANAVSSGGLHELRLTPDVRHDDLGTRQFATLNYQIYLKNGKTAKNYRSRTDPAGRSWYTDFGYTEVSVNYMDFFTNLNQTIPTVSGIVPLEVRHSRAKKTATSYLFLNPDFHAHPHHHDHPPGGMLLYKKPGLFRGTYKWDTTKLPNGVHVLYFQTEDKDSTGIHAAALKLFFNVKN